MGLPRLNSQKTKRMEAPLVSVLIPVFNTGPYLRECLDSVLGQGLSDIEVICVDDGSSDGSRAILCEYEKRDPRVRVIAFGENRGLGPARNAGLEAARGRFVCFIDSDDLLCSGILEKLCAEAEASEADIVLCWGGAFPEVKDDPACCARAEVMTRWLSSSKPFRAKRLEFSEIGRGEMPCIAGAKLYRRDFLERNALRFIGRKAVHEDEGFRVKLIVCRPLISCIPEIGFLYRIRNDSIMGSQRFGQERGSLLRVFEDAVLFARARLSAAQMQEIAPEINCVMQRMAVPFVVSPQGVALSRRAFARIKYGLLERVYRGHPRRRCQKKVKEAGEIPGLSVFATCCFGAGRARTLQFRDRLLLWAGIRILGL